jgi:hypothetical protein
MFAYASLSARVHLRRRLSNFGMQPTAFGRG